MTNQRIIFIYRKIDIGGIETLIVRLSNFLSENLKFNVIVAAENGRLSRLLSSKVLFLSLPSSLGDRNSIKIIKNKIEEEDSIIVLSFDPYSRFISDAIIQDILFKKNLHIKHVTGCFHPRAYFIEYENKKNHLANRLLSSILSNNNLYFMNNICRANHEIFLKLNDGEGPVIALPIRFSRLKWAPLNKNRLKIVTVGRIVSFKKYIFGLVEIAKSLRKYQYDIKITIYGDGDDVEELIKLIKDLDVSDIVEYCGVLDYDRFDEEIVKYDLFIGMGTAAMEAATTGIPTIITIDSNKYECYGYIQNIPVGSGGELIDGQKSIKIEDAIINYYSIDLKDRNVIGDEGRNHIKNLQMDFFWNNLNNFINRNFFVKYELKKYLFLFLYSSVARDVFKIYNNIRILYNNSAR